MFGIFGEVVFFCGVVLEVIEERAVGGVDDDIQGVATGGGFGGGRGEFGGEDQLPVTAANPAICHVDLGVAQLGSGVEEEFTVEGVAVEFFLIACGDVDEAEAGQAVGGIIRPCHL